MVFCNLVKIRYILRDVAKYHCQSTAIFNEISGMYGDNYSDVYRSLNFKWG